jgi:hypothetical protein
MTIATIPATNILITDAPVYKDDKNATARMKYPIESRPYEGLLGGRGYSEFAKRTTVQLLQLEPIEHCTTWIYEKLRGIRGIYHKKFSGAESLLFFF